jgi:hypothetical protein
MRFDKIKPSAKFGDGARLMTINEKSKQFDALLWHDSKLLGLTVSRNRKTDADDVILNLLMWPAIGQALVPVKLVFQNCSLLKLDMDLDAKRTCADDIASGMTMVTSDWIDDINKQHPYEPPLTGVCHFRINLIPPGGSLNFIASNFTIEFSGIGALPHSL